MLALLIASALAVDMPLWTRGNTLERSGTALSVVCEGHGPSLDLAREQANNACRSEAIRQVQVDLKVKSESVESDHDSAFHQEITSLTNYNGVDCVPVKEEIISGSDLTTVFLKCAYDLAKIKSTKIIDAPTATTMVVNSQVQSQDVPQVSGIVERGYKKDNSRHILLSTVPDACDTVIVNGSQVARVIRCTSNPQVITVDASKVSELVIRPKAKGYMPKTVRLTQVPSTLEVQFEEQ